MLRRCVAEFLGTALMVGAGCGSIALGASNIMIASSFGIAVTAAILVFQPISGAHINPAVTIAFWRSGHLEKQAVTPYILAQLCGATFAASFLQGIGPTTVSDDVSFLSASLVEVFITFTLMGSIYWIVLRSQTHISIAFFVGLVVALLAFFFGPMTGASMNPARTFGPNLFSNNALLIPFYSLTTVCGAWIAAEIFNRLKPNGNLNSD